MAAFDSNQWYQINIPQYSGRSLLGMTPEDNKNAAAVFFSTTNTSAPAQRWQLFATDSTTFILRTERSSPDTYLAIRNDKPRTSDSGANAIMRRVNGSGNEVFWNIERFNNGGYSLQNVANGTGWHLHSENTTLMSMTQNTTGQKDNAKFSFTGLGPINDAAYSSIVLPSGATITASSGSSTPESSDGGLSTGAKAGIGVGVGLVVLIAIIAGVFFLLRRRRQRRQRQPQGDHSVDPQPDAEAPYDKAELDAAPLPPKDVYSHKAHPREDDVQELEGNGLHEAYTNTNSPVELPGSTAEMPARAARNEGP